MTPWSTSDIPDQTGRTAIVTGATSGLGLATATELARHGAHVVLPVRDPAAGEEAARRIRRGAPDAELSVRELDLASLASVRAFAARVSAEHPSVDVLVNNAGVSLPRTRQVTVDGFELHMGTNVLAPAALTVLLLPVLTRGHDARIVSVSSITHATARLDREDLMSERSWNGMNVYGASKLVGTAFALELDRRLRAAGSPVVSVLAHPGVSRSNLAARAAADYGVLGRALVAFHTRFRAQPTEQGVLPQLHAATAPGVRGGQFFGPDGRGERRGDVTEVRPSAEAADPATGAWAWERVQRLTGVTSAVA